jgi:hypothetical protein
MWESSQQLKAMTSYDFCLAWDWEHDADFVKLLDMACRSRGLSMLQITHDNLEDVLQSLANGQISFRAFFDRASESDARFTPVVQWACDHAAYLINAHEWATRTWNKAAMHLALVNAGLHAPYTIILPSYNEQPDPTPMDLSQLGDRFTIKPAHGGGGEGVITEATSLSQVLAARQEYPADKYLLQAHIVPAQLASRPAWFRIIYCAGQVYPCWWDTHTHAYTPTTPAEESHYCLAPLRQITASIARVCGLELFSSEIALTSDGLFVVVDYVNDQIDLRLRSKAFDGVPDDIVRDIAGRLVALVAAHRPPPAGRGDVSPY